jgi:hypothetical protein
MRRKADRPRESNLRQLIILLGLVFIVALAVVIGVRMSSDAIAVLVGVIAGVAASVPTALLLMAVTRRQEEEYPEPYYEEPRQPPSPPVIVVAPGSVPQSLSPYSQPYPYRVTGPADRQREFRVMGYEEEEQPPGSEAESQPWYR